MMFYQKWDFSAKNAAKKIIECAIKNNVLLEINANGIRKGLIKYSDETECYRYPFLEFWRLVGEYEKAKVIVSDDSHDIKHLNDEATIKAYEIAKQFNLNIETNFNDWLKKKKP